MLHSTLLLGTVASRSQELTGHVIAVSLRLEPCMLGQVDHLQGRLFVDRMESATFISSSVLKAAPPGGLPMPLATGACTCDHKV